ncbi:hypothetical protein X743_33535 [Mesorhizobium sp. LNHC252B00]|nr:hypothetical protein X743_33535 [Mesorhizobium sp. LNHC252B00]
MLYQYVHRVFWQLSRQIGLRQRGQRNGPRIHDLRHRFAVQALTNWHRAGEDEDVERELPVLSTFLGHANVRDTYWYLSAAPELMTRLERLDGQRVELDDGTDDGGLSGARRASTPLG